MARVDINTLKKIKQIDALANTEQVIDEIDEYLGSGADMSLGAKKAFCDFIKYEDEGIETPIGILITNGLIERIT